MSNRRERSSDAPMRRKADAHGTEYPTTHPEPRGPGMPAPIERPPAGFPQSRANFVTLRPVRSLRFRLGMSSAANLRHFADTLPEVYTSADLAEQSVKRRAVVFALLSIVTSALLSIGAIASLVLAFG